MRQKTIFVGGFHLESNTSNPVPVEYEDFIISRGADMLPCFPEATAVFRDAGYAVLPSLYAESICVAGGILSLNAFRRIAQELLDAVPLDGSIDGVWLYLHGSMQVEFMGSGEAFLVSAIRERVGPSVPISIALDFHGNIYDAPFRVHFVKHLRDEQKFNGVNELIEQIRRDCQTARELFRANPDCLRRGYCQLAGLSP